MNDEPPTSDLSVHTSRDLGGVDALAAAETAATAFETGDVAACLAYLDRAERAVRAVARRRAETEDAALTLRSVESAIAAARDGVDAGSDDAGVRVRRALATVRHAVDRFDPAAATHRALDGPG